MNIIEKLKWRYATKKFDDKAIIASNKIDIIKDAFNLTATSYGMQPVTLLIIKDKALQKELVKHSKNQQQVSQASHLLVFGIQTNSNTELIDTYVNRVAEVRNQDLESLEGLKGMIGGFVNPMDETTRSSWFAKQAYISMGTVISAAAELRIDTCPMEGFDPTQYAEILNLNDKNIRPVCVLAIGYRSEEDVFSKMDKVRKKRNDFVLEIN